MRIGWDEFKSAPIVKVDGNTIKNAISIDECSGIVWFLSRNKIVEIKGTVEVIGERK